MRYSITPVLIFFFITSCGFTKHKNISYLKNTEKSNPPSLNVFSAKDEDSNSKPPVLIFVHGGNWDSGKKGWYSFFGKNFARKGITTVVVGYTLSPEADYDERPPRLQVQSNGQKIIFPTTTVTQIKFF